MAQLPRARDPRTLKMDEARAAADIARRIAAILLTGPELDANYSMVKKAAHPWSPVIQTEVS